MRKQQRNEKLDETELKFGVEWVRGLTTVNGWVANIKTHLVTDSNEREVQALLIFIVSVDGQWMKCYFESPPYFFVECESEFLDETMLALETKFEKTLHCVEKVDKLDLEQINHLSGSLKPYLKLSFRTNLDLVTVRGDLRKRIEKNQRNEKEQYTGKVSAGRDPMRFLLDIREYDVPYHTRVCIDSGLRCGKWFNLGLQDRGVTTIEEDRVLVAPPTLNYISFDIETSKLPLKFPDSQIDQIMMISLQYDSTALLVTNRETVGQEVEGFSYAPKPEYAVDVVIYNEANEHDLLKRFFAILHEYKPLVISSFNGDHFDWPFIEDRCIFLGLSLEDEIGMRKQEESGEYYGRFLIHMDCYCWVDRDAFLPQGSHGLKAVTRAKLGYEPVEVDPEDMVPMAQRHSQLLAEYSVSDAVSTYYLYKKHIHDFIFALSTIIPLSPDEVLRKGSGTLCECLLMAMAQKQNIIFPNKKKEQFEKFHQGHLLDSETYIGGKVECLRSGVYREEFLQNFRLDPTCLQEMNDGVPELLKFMGRVEGKQFPQSELDRCSTQIKDMITALQVKGEHVKERPLIYHLDVAAMYPNIILTNRLQPVAIVNNKVCSGCVFNSAENRCKRPLEWQRKIEYFPLQRNEYENIKNDLTHEFELHPQVINKRQYNRLHEVPIDEQQKLIKARVKMYSQKTYKTIHHHEVQLRRDTVCMRENDFYVSTVRDFRDRRYEFKELVKVWKGRYDEGTRTGNIALQKESTDRIAFYDSQQLAHKIILNSFYGYVMRKGARWYSMEMAAMVTHIGSAIISTARQWVERIGLPLELDTDGIWCMLPHGFPEDFTLMDVEGKRVKFSYPCFVLNQLVNVQYHNDQYQWLKDSQNLEYGIRTQY